MAAQFVSGIVTTLSILVVPIAILATLVGFTIALFTGIGEAGRQWFISRDEYQKKGDYEPQPGDVVYFRHGSETDSHHVGIVEFVENGILHTIEGNSGGIVRRRNYPLTADRIMGYGTPAYPDLGIDAYGSAAEFLKKAKEVGDLIVSDGNWVYSNYSNPRNLADARKGSPPKTNCARAVSIIMQEFGTLKKNQTFYAGGGGKLCASNAVRKRISQYYEIIYVGGKDDGKGAKLEPGDICIWDNHVNIYAGEDNGKKVWYDFGRKSVSDRTTETGYEAVLDFETVRHDGRNVEVKYDGTWHFRLV